jgi:hypothetical protein
MRYKKASFVETVFLIEAPRARGPRVPALLTAPERKPPVNRPLNGMYPAFR